MGTLIDSGVFIAAERGAFDLAAWFGSMADEGFSISAIGASELLHGIHRAPAGRRRETRRVFVEEILGTYPILPVDTEVATTHAELWATLVKKGRMIGAHDLLIAATALTHDLTVATLNQRHFARVPGLRLVVPA